MEINIMSVRAAIYDFVLEESKYVAFKEEIDNNNSNNISSNKIITRLNKEMSDDKEYYCCGDVIDKKFIKEFKKKYDNDIKKEICKKIMSGEIELCYNVSDYDSVSINSLEEIDKNDLIIL